MTRRWTCITACLVLGLPFAVVTDAMADIEAARRAARSAEVMVGRGQFEQANSILSNVDCGPDRYCHTLIDFTYGWLYDAWAEETPERRNALLRRSLYYYERAHDASPENTQVLRNFALVAQRAGDPKTAAAVVTDAIKLDPDNAFELYLFLGTLLQSGGDDRGALGAINQAIKLRRSDPRGHRQLLEYFRRNGATRELLDYSFGIRIEFPEVAALGLEHAMNSGYKQSPAVVEQALPVWTALRSDLGSLTANHLLSLPVPDFVESTGLRQLHTVVDSDEPPSIPDDIEWWADGRVQQDAMARLFRLKAADIRAWSENREIGLGQRTEALQTAIRFLTDAVELAPEYFVYLEDGELAGWSNVRLDAATDLVSLHHSVKAGGDPLGLSGVTSGELAEMIEMLFDGKFGAYAVGQHAAIQRYHTVLGMIYHANGRLTSSGPDNATFQLSHAIETTDLMANQEPENYRPRPDLRLLLAEVYRKSDRPAESARVSLDAAMGFLETDNLPAASAALEQANEGGADRRRAASVAVVLAGRQAVETSGARLVRVQADGKTVELGSEIEWLGDPDALDLPKRFVDGQRFKIFADLGTRFTDAGNDDLARVFNAQALDAVKDQRTLTSPSDLRRVQGLTTSIGIATSRRPVGQQLSIERGAQVTPSGQAQPQLRLPSAAGSVVIDIDEKALEESRRALEQQYRRDNQ